MVRPWPVTRRNTASALYEATRPSLNASPCRCDQPEKLPHRTSLCRTLCTVLRRVHMQPTLSNSTLNRTCLVCRTGIKKPHASNVRSAWPGPPQALLRSVGRPQRHLCQPSEAAIQRELTNRHDSLSACRLSNAVIYRYSTKRGSHLRVRQGIRSEGALGKHLA